MYNFYMIYTYIYTFKSIMSNIILKEKRFIVTFPFKNINFFSESTKYYELESKCFITEYNLFIYEFKL